MTGEISDGFHNGSPFNGHYPSSCVKKRAHRSFSMRGSAEEGVGSTLDVVDRRALVAAAASAADAHDAGGVGGVATPEPAGPAPRQPVQSYVRIALHGRLRCRFHIDDVQAAPFLKDVLDTFADLETELSVLTLTRRVLAGMLQLDRMLFASCLERSSLSLFKAQGPRRTRTV